MVFQWDKLQDKMQIDTISICRLQAVYALIDRYFVNYF